MCISLKIFWKLKRAGISQRKIAKLTNLLYYLTLGSLFIVLILSQFTSYSLAYSPDATTEQIILSITYFVLSLFNIVILLVFLISSVVLRNSQLVNQFEQKFALKFNKESIIFLIISAVVLFFFFALSYVLLFDFPVFSIIYYALVVHIVNVVNNFNENLIIYNDAMEEALGQAYFESSDNINEHSSFLN